MSKLGSQKDVDFGAPLAARWKGKASLDLVYQLNERCLELVRMVAMTAPGELAGVAQHRELWLQLDQEVIKRAARFPFLILDVHFMNDKWWCEAVELGGRQAEKVLNAEKLPSEIAVPLTYETLILAWHSARSDRRGAQLSLGMSPGVADIIAALTPKQLAEIAGNHSAELHLRWQRRTEFWSQFLRTAIRGDSGALEQAHLHAQLLHCGALIANGK